MKEFKKSTKAADPNEGFTRALTNRSTVSQYPTNDLLRESHELMEAHETPSNSEPSISTPNTKEAKLAPWWHDHTGDDTWVINYKIV